jgi:catechol 2,3-dioxygenase-like lactoylglutathione lyase family enzyme
MFASSGRGRRGNARREPCHVRVQAECIDSIHRVVSNLARAESFYRSALGFHTQSKGPLDCGLMEALGVADRTASEVRMRLGREDLVLVQFEPQGSDYPVGSQSDDLWFQHIAIVVRDMNQAYARLCSNTGWHPISDHGPQTLPASSGGVSAFKFRDPDRHPLELLWFPPGHGRALWHEWAQQPAASDEPFLGIDHSALAVSSTRRSIAFYHSLGLRISTRSLNSGPEQSRLDGISDARVRVTGLRPASETGPGLELLAYQPPGRARQSSSAADLSTDWTTLTGILAGRPEDQAAAADPGVLMDPDGHRFVLVPQRIGALGSPA